MHSEAKIMKKIDFMVLLFIGLFAFGYPISAVYMQNNREYYIIARTPENGNWSVEEINMKLGSNIILTVISDDVTHSFYIEEFNIDVELYPGKAVEITINANIAGEFIFKCYVYCSPTHTSMIGKLIVSP